MYLAHAIVETRAVYGECSHIELVVTGHPAQPHEILSRNAKFMIETFEICVYHVIAEIDHVLPVPRYE